VTKPGFRFLGSFYVVVYFVTMHVAFVVFVSVFQYQAKRLAGKNVSEMTCFVSGAT